jgi:hypothetical protein
MNEEQLKPYQTPKFKDPPTPAEELVELKEEMRQLRSSIDQVQRGPQ